MKRSLFLPVAMLISFSANSQVDTSAYKVYYGLLHAHTMISDGSGTPEEAYDSAKAKGLDFFAITPHNHADAEAGAKERKDGVLIATNHALYNGSGNITVARKWKESNTSFSETVSVKPLIKAAKDATTGKFVALYGQEFSTISKGNHVNVFGIDHVLEVENGNFRGLVAEMKTNRQSGGMEPVVQFNHPDVSQDLFYKGNSAATKGHMYNDYGIDDGDLGPHFKDLATAMGPYAHMIEVLSGPALTRELRPGFRYDANENDYFFYLKQGFHFSPTAGQDNHYKTWGAITNARTGVMCTSLTSASLFDAFRKNRTFATEDKNLKAVLYVNDSLMGASVTAKEESELDIKVWVSDMDEPGATYEIDIYGGEIKPELSTGATNWKAADGLLEHVNVTGNGIYTVKDIFSTAMPSFYYARITQSSPANSNDERAWTAPIWVNETKAANVPAAGLANKFYWASSSSSKVYHIKGCSSVDRIKPDHLVSGQTPPPGRTLHSCVVTESNTGH